MFKTRLISGAILLALIIMLCVFGGLTLWAFIAVISVIGLSELYKTVGMQKSAPAIVCYIISALIDSYLFITHPGEGGITAQVSESINKVLPSGLTGDKLSNPSVFPAICLFGLAFILVMAIYVFKYPEFNSNQITMVLYGLMYVTVFMACVPLTRALEDGKLTVWLIFICAWGSDTCAYCVGRLIGKHPLPGGLHELSPKKTSEGCIGGIVGAALIGAIFAACVYADKSFIWKYALICGVGSLIGMVGDLNASAIKRNHDIKDYGDLIPGHGGIMDRFDSILLTAPIVFVLASLF